MMRWLICMGFVVMLANAAWGADRAKSKSIDPDTAIRPLEELMAVSTNKVGKESLCTDATQANQTIAIGRILAQAFAYQSDGRNVTTGRCEAAGDGQCDIFIRHAKGEDVWEKHLVFRSVAGKADPSTLQCLDAG